MPFYSLISPITTEQALVFLHDFLLSILGRFGGLLFGLDALAFQILGALPFPVGQRGIVRHLDAAGEGPVQAVPARHPVFLEHAPAGLTAPALTDGTLGQRFSLLF